MIIDKIKLYSNDVEIANFGLVRSDLSQSYIVSSIAGLDVSDIKMQFYGTQLSSGPNPKDFYRPTLDDREVVIRIRLNPQQNESYSSLRDKLYSSISSSNPSDVQLRFMVGNTVRCVLNGYIKKLENQLFNLNPEMQITIRCEDPMFRSLNYVDQPRTGFNSGTVVIENNVSTAPHGFKASAIIMNTATNFSMHKTPAVFEGDIEWYFVVHYQFEIGDTIEISSEEDDRYIAVRPVGSQTSFIQITDRLDSSSIWPMMFPGRNSFTISNPTLNWTSFRYKNAYWGI